MSDQQKFGTLKNEARLNVKRIDPMGVELQRNVMRLFVQPGLAQLAKMHEPDTRCSTCAGREGTIPGGCIVTQADFLKAVHENVPFHCHAHTDAKGQPDRACHAWIAARLQLAGKILPAPWPWSSEYAKESP